MTKYRTIRECNAVLPGHLGFKEVRVPKHTRCTPTGDGEFFVEDWHQWGGEILAPGTIRDHDATYRGIRLASDKVEEVPTTIPEHRVELAQYAIVMRRNRTTTVMLRTSEHAAKVLAGALWTAIADDEGAWIEVVRVSDT